MNEQIVVLKSRDKFKREMTEKGFRWVGLWVCEDGKNALDNLKKKCGRDYQELNKVVVSALSSDQQEQSRADEARADIEAKRRRLAEKLAGVSHG